jgi:hypothetical protein
MVVHPVVAVVAAHSASLVCCLCSVHILAIVLSAGMAVPMPGGFFASGGARCRVSGSDNLVMSVVMSAGQVPLPIVGRCVKRYRNVRQF